MKVFVVIDTNVLVSAFLSMHSDSATSIILANLFSEKIIPLFNEEILMEYEEVLHRAKFHFPENDVRLVLSAILEYGISSERIKCEDDFSDPKDIVFYEVALSKEGSQKKDLFSLLETQSTSRRNPLSLHLPNFLKY